MDKLRVYLESLVLGTWKVFKSFHVYSFVNTIPFVVQTLSPIKSDPYRP